MITQRVERLREWMHQQGIDVLVVPTMDPHNSEYVPEHWKCRQWLTGFTGSAGTAVVTATDARLWTDSRYWLQATDQLTDTPFTLMREGEDTDVANWINDLQLTAYEVNLANELHVAYPADMMTRELYRDLFIADAHPCQEDPFDLLWTDRTAFPLSKAEILPDYLTGESARSKVQRLREWMEQKSVPGILVNDLSEIAWLLNLRADDVPFNPYLIAFLYIGGDNDEHALFTRNEQITPEVAAYLADLGIEVCPYEEGLAMLQEDMKENIPTSPVAEWRAAKNATEQAGFREAHIRDGVAMVRFLHWLDQLTPNADGLLTDAAGEVVTELTVDRTLTAFRAEQSGYRSLSFETIAAYGPHGAIVHYEATPESDVPLEARSLLLLDSGAHYASHTTSADQAAPAQAFCGTTDITRTIALGPLTDEERRVYTLVLKGHLQLAHLHFPDGTTGLQLDTAARMAMWREGYDFGHGTGHGVGHCLGVHEGPVQIRKNLRGCTTLPFHAGQNVTDEPGIYVPGRFGVRIENLLFAVPDRTTDFGQFLRFEAVTLCPYDLRPIVVEMLTAEERQWLNDYHSRVRQILTPLLPSEAEQQWLAHATRAI